MGVYTGVDLLLSLLLGLWIDLLSELFENLYGQISFLTTA